ncbi:hypothetical protein [Nocardia nova]|uniref:hypothetical protein n=1 Tax=Nocardia nova TaxID=37330 RepID=UPI003F7588BC
MSDAPSTVAVRPDSVLFSEPGARWRTVAYGPLLCLLVLILELALRRGPVHWFGLAFCAILLAGFVTLQVVAGKRHVSVELTDSVLRQGTETLPVSSIARIFPEHDKESWDDDPWQSARALGELTAVPRRRRGIGLKLRDGAMVQAWARDHQQLRARLSAAIDRLAEDSAPATEEPAAAAGSPEDDEATEGKEDVA